MIQLIPLTKGLFAKVDAEDFEWVSKFSWKSLRAGNTIYANTSVYDGKRKSTLMMHREILKRHGLLEESKFVDHIDRDGLNNQKSNLRNCTHTQNMANRKACGVSKYLGVHLRVIKCKQKTYSYWIGSIRIDGKSKHLGNFKSEVDAAISYNEAARIHHGEFANLNRI